MTATICPTCKQSIAADATRCPSCHLCCCAQCRESPAETVARLERERVGRAA